MSVVARAGFPPPRESPPGPHLKLLETLQKPARWDHPTAPPNARPAAVATDRSEGDIIIEGVARAVGVYGCLRDLREPEVRGRASDGATAATDMVFEREHQSGCAVGVDAC